MANKAKKVIDTLKSIGKSADKDYKKMMKKLDTKKPKKAKKKIT